MDPEDLKFLQESVLNGRISYSTEKELQELIAQRLESLGDDLKREYRLSSREILDFFWESRQIGLEIKIKGTNSQLYRQLIRYSQYDQLKEIVVIRHRGGFPFSKVGGMPVHFIELWKNMI